MESPIKLLNYVTPHIAKSRVYFPSNQCLFSQKNKIAINGDEKSQDFARLEKQQLIKKNVSFRHFKQISMKTSALLFVNCS